MERTTPPTDQAGTGVPGVGERPDEVIGEGAAAVGLLATHRAIAARDARLVADRSG
jgi:hypothetical protein